MLVTMLRRGSASLIVIAVALGGSTAACKKEKKPPSTSQINSGTTATTIAVNLCGMFTQDDLKAALGATFGAAEARSAVQCQWANSAGDVKFTVTLAVGDYAATKQILTGNGAPSEDVSGVGDQAFVSSTPSALTLVVGTGARTYVFGYAAPTVNAATATPKVVALAKHALATLSG